MSAMHMFSKSFLHRSLVVLTICGLTVGPVLGCSMKPPGVDELIIEDVEVGEGPEVEVGDVASLHYTGWLYDPSKEGNRGTFFDSSRTRGKPFHLRADPGSGGVIEGWHQGVLGMRLGGKRVITIPPELAYGEKTAGGGIIVPHSTLVFELELVRLKKKDEDKPRIR